jgi:hypothetical protein
VENFELCLEVATENGVEGEEAVNCYNGELRCKNCPFGKGGK